MLELILDCSKHEEYQQKSLDNPEKETNKQKKISENFVMKKNPSTWFLSLTMLKLLLPSWRVP